MPQLNICKSSAASWMALRHFRVLQGWDHIKGSMRGSVSRRLVYFRRAANSRTRPDVQDRGHSFRVLRRRRHHQHHETTNHMSWTNVQSRCRRMDREAPEQVHQRSFHPEQVDLKTCNGKNSIRAHSTITKSEYSPSNLLRPCQLGSMAMLKIGGSALSRLVPCPSASQNICR